MKSKTLKKEMAPNEINAEWFGEDFDVEKERGEDGKFHYLYVITNNKTEKPYYGIHSTEDLDDGYICSGKDMVAEIRKLGGSAFTRQIIAFSKNREDIASKEHIIVTHSGVPQMYNKKIGGQFKDQSQKSHNLPKNEWPDEGIEWKAPADMFKAIVCLKPWVDENIDREKLIKEIGNHLKENNK